ncbi:hypothetical protein GGX14DRAFT_402277 [Mycena pura]|uniref:Uncharacterized protein n=1 Tax=Mycena pura TaxID=153505 RepID=A0AAD6Y7I4_9AGAR|nr:hypothetical protein GGX14DRAFT_402277 [Mycena pura]
MLKGAPAFKRRLRAERVQNVPYDKVPIEEELPWRIGPKSTYIWFRQRSEQRICSDHRIFQWKLGEFYRAMLVKMMSLKARAYLSLYGQSENARVYWLLCALLLRRLQDAVNLTPEGHPDRPQHLHQLSRDLEAALRAAQAAVDLAPEAHSDVAHLLGDINDHQAALQNSQKALDLTPEGHSDRALRLRDLARCVEDQYRIVKKDLDSASRKLQEAIALMPEGHPERAWSLEFLAVAIEYGRVTVPIQVLRKYKIPSASV